MGQVHGTTEALRSDVAGLRAGIAHMEGSTKSAIDQRASDLGIALKNTESPLRHDMGRLRAVTTERFERLEERVDQRFEQVDEQLLGLTVWTASTDERFGQVDRRFDYVDTRFDGIDLRFGQVDQRLDGIDQRLDRVDKRLDTMDGKLDRLLAAAEGGNVAR